MKTIFSAVILCVALSACTTPKTMLKNEKTGQVVDCGGSATGSMVGGVIGYHIQKSNDSDCVADYMDQGFKRIKTTDEPASQKTMKSTTPVK